MSFVYLLFIEFDNVLSYEGWKHRENVKQYFLQFYPAFAAKKQAEQQAAMMSGYGAHPYGMHAPAPMQQGMFRPPPGAPQHIPGQPLGQPPHMQMFHPPHMQMPPPLYQMQQFPQMPYQNMPQQVGSISDASSTLESAVEGVLQDSMKFSSDLQEPQLLASSTSMDSTNLNISQPMENLNSVSDGQI